MALWYLWRSLEAALGMCGSMISTSSNRLNSDFYLKNIDRREEFLIFKSKFLVLRHDSFLKYNRFESAKFEGIKSMF